MVLEMIKDLWDTYVDGCHWDHCCTNNENGKEQPILKDCKTLPVFLDHIFGFLHRRTDFYHEAPEPKSPVGLPKGLAEHLVKHAYFKWIRKQIEKPIIYDESEIPEAVVEEIVISEDQAEEITMDFGHLNLDNPALLQPGMLSKNELNLKFTQSESYNGSAFEHYCWSQTIKDLDITLKVPENATSKNLKVSIFSNKIEVKMKDIALLQGELYKKCKYNEAIWSLDRQKLQIHLDKCLEEWWNCLILSEDRLDLSTLDCSRPFEDLPEDAQAKIEELGWNQERKRLGLPTSDELAKQELLRKAWAAEGSPFTGPFDPTQVAFHS
ncbi:hypothetical protein HUJ05_009819 [Dendroctonus ponderosae]|nr:hypothetical protein HUJ05_009819 [Dendroctonus ponderosae]